MKYQVGGAVHASTFIGEFEANSPQEAIEKAYREAHVSVCHQCAESIQDPEPAELWAEDEDGNVTHETSASHPAEAAAPPGEQAGKAQGWRDPRKDGRPDALQLVQFWTSGNTVVCAGFRKDQTWYDMFDQYPSGAQEYDECYVVGWAPLLPAPPTKDPTNG